jgi:hypothetical protein
LKEDNIHKRGKKSVGRVVDEMKNKCICVRKFLRKERKNENKIVF